MFILRSRNLFLALVPLLTAACATAPPEIYKENDHSVVFFELINEANASEIIRSLAPAAVDGDREDSLVSHCGGVPDDVARTRRMQAYATKLHVSPAGTFTGENLLKEYAALWGNRQMTTHFYQAVGVKSPPVLKWTCFRLIRALCRQAREGREKSRCDFTRDDVHMDLIGEFKLMDEAVLKIRPLRLFYNKSIAEADGSMGVSIDITATAVWRDANSGRQEQVFSGHLLDERLSVRAPNQVTGIKRNDSKPKNVKYYSLATSEWNDYPRLPVVPWSVRDGLGTPTSSGDAGVVTLSVQVAEVGRVPELLSAFDDVLTHYGDAIGKQLLKAAEKAYEAEAVGL